MTNKILVLCTGNSCRSQIAEGYLRHFAGNKAEIYSVGVETHGVNPKAIETNHSCKKRIAEKFDEYILTHVLTHTGIGNNGGSSTKWIYDLRVSRKSGLKRAKSTR